MLMVTSSVNCFSSPSFIFGYSKILGDFRYPIMLLLKLLLNSRSCLSITACSMCNTYSNFPFVFLFLPYVLVLVINFWFFLNFQVMVNLLRYFCSSQSDLEANLFKVHGLSFCNVTILRCLWISKGIISYIRGVWICQFLSCDCHGRTALNTRTLLRLSKYWI
jgi:hypothetical protein